MRWRVALIGLGVVVCGWAPSPSWGQQVTGPERPGDSVQPTQQESSQRGSEKWKAGAAKTEDGAEAWTERVADVARGRGSRRPARPAAVACRWERVDDPFLLHYLLEQIPIEGDGYFAKRMCRVENENWELRDVRWVKTREPNPVELAEAVREQLVLPRPVIVLTPAVDRLQIVHFETWLHTEEWQPWSETAVIDGVSATVVATPVSVRWDMGDGAVVECAGPGALYDFSRRAVDQATDCGHTYRRTSAAQPGQTYIVTATTRYALAWQAAGAVAAAGSLGFVERSASVPVRVGEVRALEVGPRRPTPSRPTGADRSAEVAVPGP